MDRYTKFILTTIAVGIIGINYHLFNGDIISEANASSHEIHKIAICNENGSRCATVGKQSLGSGSVNVLAMKRF